jgi:hypothetical protein
MSHAAAPYPTVVKMQLNVIIAVKAIGGAFR